ncbi:hypothetical protein [Roseibium aggregatum]|uniref:Uncharacterized protein n=1 Tax=Roseibium aggregatum TaxID=187304 RepID=A0A939EAN2_9HYPH|nr:hypothetical protein [Roseibium aggregatum]MBN9669438.1 hypothetical protein [Roseibium aggregatum]
MKLLKDHHRAEFIREIGNVDFDKRVRPLNARELEDARKVFGKSIDYARVLVSDQLGVGDRAWCELAYYEPEVQTFGDRVKVPFNILNAGKRNKKTGELWDQYPRQLLHELTHVWQSQHAFDPHAYFKNSMKNQSFAVILGFQEGNVDLFSAYEFVPGKKLSEYNAEQVARGVGTHRDTTLINHIRSVQRNFSDAQNEKSLTVISVVKDASKAVEHGFIDNGR